MGRHEQHNERHGKHRKNLRLDDSRTLFPSPVALCGEMEEKFGVSRDEHLLDRIAREEEATL